MKNLLIICSCLLLFSCSHKRAHHSSDKADHKDSVCSYAIGDKGAESCSKECTARGSCKHTGKSKHCDNKQCKKKNCKKKHCGKKDRKKHNWKKMDKNADGLVSKQEFHEAHVIKFDKMDKNSDGYISHDEKRHNKRHHHKRRGCKH